jgi:hypothetical protein
MYSYNWNAIKAIAQLQFRFSESRSGLIFVPSGTTFVLLWDCDIAPDWANVVPEGTNINPDLDSEKRNCKSQDLTTNLADEKPQQHAQPTPDHIDPHMQLGQ